MGGWIRPKPISACPSCGCRKLWRNRTYPRTVLALGGPKTLRATQRRCARCRRTWADPVRGVEKGARYAREVKREAVRVLFEQPRNVPEAVAEVRRRRGFAPSATTVRRAMRQAASGIRWPDAPSDGILLVDEKFARVEGEKRPALVARDASAVVRAVRVLPNRKPEAIEAVLRPVAERTEAHTLVSDDHRSYPVVARRLRLRHQICQTHLLRKVNRKLHIYLSRKRWGMTREKRKREKDRIRSLFHAFCNSERPVKYLPAIADVGRRHRPLRRFVGHVLSEWRKYHTFRRVPGCPKTNNGSEGGIARLDRFLRLLKGFRNFGSAQVWFDLWALQENFRPYTSGKFAGLCPLQVAGVDTTGKDWLDWTGLAD